MTTPIKSRKSPGTKPSEKRQTRGTRRTEELLRRGELLEKIMDHVPVMIAFIDPQGRTEYVNRHWQELLGWSLEEARSLDILAEMYPDPEVREEILALVLAGEGDWRDYRTRTKDDRILDTSWANVPLSDGSSIGIGYDITARKQEQEALRQSEVHFRALVENGWDGLTVVDRDFNILYSSPTNERIIGYRPDERAGKHAAEFIHPDDLEQVLEYDRQLIERPGGVHRLEYRARARDGSWRWIESIAQNRLDETDIGAIVINFRDVTERKQAEERIRRQLERLTALGEIDRAIASSFDLGRSLETLLWHVIRQLGVDAADVLLFEPAEQTLKYGAGSGFRTQGRESLSVNVSQDNAGRSILEGQIINVRNLKDQPNHPGQVAFLEAETFVSYSSVPLIVKGEPKGVLEVFHRRAFEPDDEWLDFFNALAGQAAIAIDNATLFQDIQQSHAELSQAYDATIEGWSRALDLRDKETEGHTRRVTDMTVRLARLFGLNETELVQVRWGALLHDIGKMGVPDEILFKRGPLNEAEWAIMKQHPSLAYEMLAPIGYLHAALDIPHCHHEKWDGQGYPRGLSGEQIPLAARIFAAVDIWDALRSDRPYREAWPAWKVREHIRSLSGSYLDPRVVQVCLESDIFSAGELG